MLLCDLIAIEGIDSVTCRPTGCWLLLRWFGVDGGSLWRPSAEGYYNSFYTKLLQKIYRARAAAFIDPPLGRSIARDFSRSWLTPGRSTYARAPGALFGLVQRRYGVFPIAPSDIDLTWRHGFVDSIDEIRTFGQAHNLKVIVQNLSLQPTFLVGSTN